ncbi:MAG: molecular chaperone DnaJ [Pseudomonadales bacterium]|nr:molecular chaperone DnaJ [Pseudomonadales bacterium]
MYDNADHVDERQWVIWNVTLGLRDTVVIGEIETGANGRQAWLDEPYDMVGPFCLDQLETTGQIRFEACVVMSQERWQREQAEQRRQAHINRRAFEERVADAFARFNARRGDQQQSSAGRPAQFQRTSDKRHRELLNLPVEGELKVTQIKVAYRRLAQKAHPDAGGEHELFVQITEARDALLEQAS